MKTIIQFLRCSSIICSLITTVLLVSCRDDDGDSSGNPKIVGVWKKVKEESRQDAAEWQVVTENCDLDDTEVYKAGGDWAFYPGTVTCGSAAVLSGSWSLRANNTKVVYTYNDFDGEFESNIEELTDTRLVLTHGAGDDNDTRYRDTYFREQ